MGISRLWASSMSVVSQMQASKEQLQDVWEKEDEMPKEDFEPKKFFLMHGEYAHTCSMYVRMFTDVCLKWAKLGL